MVTFKTEIKVVIIHQSILYELLSNLIGSLLLYYAFILHWFTFYGAFKLLILHGFTVFWWIRLIRQQFAANCSSPGRYISGHFTSCAAYDGFGLKSSCTQTVAETVLKFLLHLSSFVYVFKLHWFSSYIQELHQLPHANWVSTGQTVKSRPVVCCWITRFFESQCMESLCLGKDLKKDWWVFGEI